MLRLRADLAHLNCGLLLANTLVKLIEGLCRAKNYSRLCLLDEMLNAVCSSHANFLSSSVAVFMRSPPYEAMPKSVEALLRPPINTASHCQQLWPIKQTTSPSPMPRARKKAAIDKQRARSSPNVTRSLSSSAFGSVIEYFWRASRTLTATEPRYASAICSPFTYESSISLFIWRCLYACKTHKNKRAAARIARPEQRRPKQFAFDRAESTIALTASERSMVEKNVHAHF